MKNQKGFTLIELIVMLGLAGIVLTVVMSFLITNVKTYETISSESEVQYQSQYIINFMTDKIMEAKSYEEKPGNKYEFKYYDGKVSSFELNESKKVIEYNDNIKTVHIGKYVKELKIEPHGIDNKEVKVTLILEKGKGSYKAEQIVYMRNS